MQQDTLINTLTEKIIDELRRAGISSEKIAKELKRIDGEFQSQIASEIIGSMGEDEVVKLTNLNWDHVTIDELKKYLPVDENSTRIRYIQKVQDYITTLPYHIKSLESQNHQN